MIYILPCRYQSCRRAGSGRWNWAATRSGTQICAVPLQRWPRALSKCRTAPPRIWNNQRNICLMIFRSIKLIYRLEAHIVVPEHKWNHRIRIVDDAKLTLLELLVRLTRHDRAHIGRTNHHCRHIFKQNKTTFSVLCIRIVNKSTNEKYCIQSG